MNSIFIRKIVFMGCGWLVTDVSSINCGKQDWMTSEVGNEK